MKTLTRMTPLLALLPLASACGSSVDTGAFDDDAGGTNTDGGGPGTDVGVDAPSPTTCAAKVTFDVKNVVAELRAKTPLPIAMTLADDGIKSDHPLKLVLVKSDGTEVKTLVDATRPLGAMTFDFVPSAIADLVPDAYTLRATLGCPAEAKSATPAKQETKIFVLRLGAKSIGIDKGDGEKFPLLYHAVGGASKNYYPIPATAFAASMETPSGEPELDAKDGTPRTFPALWTKLDTPLVDGSDAVIDNGTTNPISLKIGTKPDVVFTLGKTAAGGAGNVPNGLALPGVPAIRIAFDAGAPTGTEGVIDAEKTTIRLATSPVPAIQKTDLSLEWHFEAKNTAGDWVAIPDAKQKATVRIYGVLGNDQGDTSPNLPWVAVVDDVTTKIAGAASDADGARSILVQHVYEEMGLAYDRRAGASHYCGPTASDGYSAESFYLSSFLLKKYGNIVNCSDCASILSTYANMIGAKLHYAIIGWNFGLNPIEGIGSTVFGSPFDSGRFQFSYHAVTTPNATANIYDATLAVDGDADPTTAPQTKQLVQNLTGTDYLKRLSNTTPEYKYADQKTTVQ